MISASRRRDIDRQKAPLASLLEKQATSIFLLAALPSYMLAELTERAVELNTFSRGSKKTCLQCSRYPSSEWHQLLRRSCRHLTAARYGIT